MTAPKVSSCAFRDCGDPDCYLCALARMPQPKKIQGKAADGLRDDAKAVPVAPGKPARAAKRRNRVGPHR